MRRLRDEPGIFWHGSPSGDLRGSHYGLHLGSYDAAEAALNARIGAPNEGFWDGGRRYGETMIKPWGAGFLADEELKAPRLPTGLATYSDRTPIPLDVYPSIHPYRLVGPMSNASFRPYEDFKANGYMSAAIKRGNPRRGMYYINRGEDDGSLSIVVPRGQGFVEPVEFRRGGLALYRDYCA